MRWSSLSNSCSEVTKRHQRRLLGIVLDGERRLIFLSCMLTLFFSKAGVESSRRLGCRLPGSLGGCTRVLGGAVRLRSVACCTIAGQLSERWRLASWNV